MYVSVKNAEHKVGVNDHEGPPVPIPNTEVKLMSVESTWVATPWEDRTMPTLFYKKSLNWDFIYRIVKQKVAFIVYIFTIHLDIAL